MSADTQMFLLQYPAPQEWVHSVARICVTVLLCAYQYLIAAEDSVPFAGATHGIACFNYSILYSRYVEVIRRSLQQPFDSFVPCQILSERSFTTNVLESFWRTFYHKHIGTWRQSICMQSKKPREANFWLDVQRNIGWSGALGMTSWQHIGNK